MLINNDRWHEMGGVNNMANMMGLSTDHSFQLVNTHQGRVNDHVLYFRYQQYYNNIAVEGGGFTVAALAVPGTTSGPDDPCLQVQMLSPFVATDIHLSDQTTVNTSNLESIVENHYGGGSGVEVSYVDSDLLYWPNLLNDCAYHLTWDVKYTVDGALKRAWVDAENGTVLKTINAHMNLPAPMATPGYGNLPGNRRDLDDFFDGGATRLINGDGIVSTYDFIAWPPSVENSEWPAANIPSTNAPEWPVVGSTRETYQAHFATTACVDEFFGLGIEFSSVRVASSATYIGALAYTGSSVDDARIRLGSLLGSTTALYDVIAHELGHCYMLGTGLEYTDPGNASIHEGIADMFGTYIESLIQGNADWVIGDDEPNVALGVDRDLSNPAFDCFSDVAGLGFNDRHMRSTPLSHWFFLVSQGDVSFGISPIGMEAALNIVVSALNSGSSLNDYLDFRDAVLGVAETEYGICTEEYASIIRAWRIICVGGSTPPPCYEIGGQLTGNVATVCKENNELLLCIEGGPENAVYRWLVQGGVDWTANGQTGTNTFTGNCLDVDDFGVYPYYPQTIKVSVYSPNVHPEFNDQYIWVRIVDCGEQDAPTCQEYYNNEPLLSGANPPSSSTNSYGITREFDSPTLVERLGQQVKVYDLLGRLIFEGDKGQFEQRYLEFHEGVLLCAYFDENGAWLGTQKIIPLK